MRNHTIRSSRLAGMLATVAILLAALTGCGEQTLTDDPTASAGSTESSSTGETVSDADFDSARDAYDLTLAQCLRDNGFDVADPQSGQGIQETTPGIQEAASACMQEIGDPPTVNAEMDDTEVLTWMLEVADCFRDLGYEIEEPTLGGALVVPDDATQADADACLSDDQ